MMTYSVYSEWSGKTAVLARDVTHDVAAKTMARARLGDQNADIYALASDGEHRRMRPVRGPDGDWGLTANTSFSAKDAKYMLDRD
jgi:hypothetical protein